MLRLGDRVKFSKAAVAHNWEIPAQLPKPNLTVTGTVLEVRPNNIVPSQSSYRISWADGFSYGLSNIWAEEWLERIDSDEIGIATEKWEHYFGAENEQ